MRVLHVLLSGFFVAVVSLQSQAALLFSDNFNSYSTGLAVAAPPGLGGNWTATPNIDVMNDLFGGTFGIPGFSQGNYVDLGGTLPSGNASATLATAMVFAPGPITELKIVSFGLAGNNRSFGPAVDSVLVSLGGWSETFLLNKNAGFTQFTRAISNTFTGSLSFQVTTPFTTTDASEQGPLLDNVSVNTEIVPEPAFCSIALLAGGLAFMRRRRLKK